MLLSLTSSLHSVAANADWTVLGSEPLVSLAHGVGMGYLGSRVEPVAVAELKSCLKSSSRGPSNGRKTGSRFTRLCNFLRRKAGVTKCAAKGVSVMKGSRAASLARERRGSWLDRWFVPKRARFDDRVMIKVLSRREEWDRDFDLSSEPYARPLLRARVHRKGRCFDVDSYLEPHGRSQLHFPRTRFIRDSCDAEQVDDDGDIEMDLS